MDRQPRGPDGKRRWAAVGRDREQVAQTLAGLKLDDIDIVVADLDQAASLHALARRTAVVVNLAGPYTQKAAGLIEACVEAGTSYVDLSGEIPLLRRVIDRFDAPARAAGVQVVQMAGWDGAMPADLTTLLACRRAAGDAAGVDGPGAADPIAEVVVSVTFTRRPEGGVPFEQQVSAGTMASVVAMLDDPDAALVGHADALLPGGAATERRIGSGSGKTMRKDGCWDRCRRGVPESADHPSHGGATRGRPGRAIQRRHLRRGRGHGRCDTRRCAQAPAEGEGEG